LPAFGQVWMRGLGLDCVFPTWGVSIIEDKGSQ